mgnify:CR=1 FL=1
MLSEIHAAALRAAAKVAFSAAFIGGCNAQSESVSACLKTVLHGSTIKLRQALKPTNSCTHIIISAPLKEGKLITNASLRKIRHEKRKRLQKP